MRKFRKAWTERYTYGETQKRVVARAYQSASEKEERKATQQWAQQHKNIVFVCAVTVAWTHKVQQEMDLGQS